MGDLLIEAAGEFARGVHAGDATGHDWWHVWRVWRMARRLAADEGADAVVCEVAALLHDVADEKLNGGDGEAGLARVREWLEGRGEEIDAARREHVLEIIGTMSFKGGGGGVMRTLEGAIVRDADRLDAIGAIGVARAFMYSGARGQAMHEPGLAPREAMTREEYRTGRSTAINHFHEKLLKLKGTLTTAGARREAERRHEFMNEFLAEFEREWGGE